MSEADGARIGADRTASGPPHGALAPRRFPTPRSVGFVASLARRDPRVAPPRVVPHRPIGRRPTLEPLVRVPDAVLRDSGPRDAGFRDAGFRDVGPLPYRASSPPFRARAVPGPGPDPTVTTAPPRPAGRGPAATAVADVAAPDVAAPFVSDRSDDVAQRPAEARGPSGTLVGAPGVEIRRGPEAERLTARAAARAVSTAATVHLPDRHGPLGSPRADALLAHELVHVAARRSEPPSAAPGPEPRDAEERAALAVEAAVREGREPGPRVGAHGPVAGSGTPVRPGGAGGTPAAGPLPGDRPSPAPVTGPVPERPSSLAPTADVVADRATLPADAWPAAEASQARGRTMSAPVNRMGVPETPNGLAEPAPPPGLVAPGPSNGLSAPAPPNGLAAPGTPNGLATPAPPNRSAVAELTAHPWVDRAPEAPRPPDGTRTPRWNEQEIEELTRLIGARLAHEAMIGLERGGGLVDLARW